MGGPNNDFIPGGSYIRGNYPALDKALDEMGSPMPDRAVVVEISKDNAEHLVTILEVILDGGESSPADARLLETLAFDLRCKLDDLNA